MTLCLQAQTEHLRESVPAPLNNCFCLQVDEALHALSSVCNCSLMELVSRHSQALLKLLQPVPESMHAAADLVAYSHLLLPWDALSHATQAAAAAATTEAQLPRFMLCSATVPEQQVECLHLVLVA